MLVMKVALTDSSSRPDLLHSVVDSKFEVAQDALRREGTKAVELIQQIGVEGSG